MCTHTLSPQGEGLRLPRLTKDPARRAPLRFGGQQRVQLLQPTAAALGFGYIILSEETVVGGNAIKMPRFFAAGGILQGIHLFDKKYIGSTFPLL